jgi:hypothetical protein
MLIKKMTLIVMLSSLPLLSNNLLEKGLNDIVEIAENKKVDDEKFLNNTFKQRMRTQMISRDAILISMNINKKNYQESILKNSKEFDVKFQNLINDKNSIDRVIKELPSFKEKIETFKKTWSDFYINVKQVEKDSKDKKALNYIIKNNLKLLREIDFIFSNFLRFYQSSDNLEKSMMHIRTMLFSQVGKPRMYITKIIKERLLIKLGIDKKENQKNLNETIKNMDKLMKALRNGDKSLELNGTEDRKIIEKLTISQKIWEDLKVIVKKDKLDDETLNKMLKLNKEFIEVHNIVVSLTKSSVDN